MSQEVLLPTKCSKCGAVWDPQRHDMVQLFNHSALHTWLERNFQGTFHGSIRTAVPEDQRQAWIGAWIREELLLMYTLAPQLRPKEKAMPNI